MATPKIIADFETQLATALAVGGTSFTLASATDDDGVALPDGLYYFTVDGGISNKEYLAGTLAGTSVTSVASVSRQGVEASGAARAHRVGASVLLTDFLTYKKYMDEIALVSAPDASQTDKGVVETATLAEVRARTGTGATGALLAVTPNVLDDMTTQDEKAALAGGGDFGTPSASNKFVTEEYLPTISAPQTVTFTSSGTWTKDAGLKYIEVEVLGAGGGGGGANGSAGNFIGSGGGAGGRAVKRILASALGATETVTIGAGGTVANDANGNAGGTSSFGSHCSATGGAGGARRNGAGGAGGVGSGGDFNLNGNRGFVGDITAIHSGAGADSPYGVGGATVLSGETPGNAGVGNVSGGSGGRRTSGSQVIEGGVGAPGIVIVTEYYS